MAKITGFQDGSVNDSGKVNWRGDQTTAPNAQSIYNASQVQLAELGARMVVGDRVLWQVGFVWNLLFFVSCLL